MNLSIKEVQNWDSDNIDKVRIYTKNGIIIMPRPKYNVIFIPNL